MEEKKGISRRGFLKTAALAGAALAMPAGLEKVFAVGPAKADTPRNDTEVARIQGHRILGSGKAAFEVSALGFGVMGMSYNRSQHPDKKQCIRLLHEAVERGVTLFDTAIIYGPLTNELLAGEALAEFRGKINVTTKFGHEVIDGKGTGRQDSSRKTVRQYCEDSLRRLKLDSLQMFYQHRADPDTPAEEVAQTIAEGGQGTTLGHVRSECRDHPPGTCRMPADGHPERIPPDAPRRGDERSAGRLPRAGYRIRAVQSDQPGIFGRLHQRIYGLRPDERQPPDPATFSAGGDTGKYTHRERAATVRTHARHDLCAGGTRLAVAESPVDRADSRNDETFASGREPAHARFQPRRRGVARTRNNRRGHSRRRRPLQRRTTAAGRTIKSKQI